MLYLVAGVAVLVLSAVMSMAGLGVAFLVVPLLYWMGRRQSIRQINGDRRGRRRGRAGLL